MGSGCLLIFWEVWISFFFSLTLRREEKIKFFCLMMQVTVFCKSFGKVTSEAGQGCGWGRGERRGGATAGSWHRQPIKTLDSIQSANQSAGFIAPVTDSQSAPWILINQPIRAQDSLLLTQTAKQSIITLLFVSNNYNIWYGENVWFGLVCF